LDSISGLFGHQTGDQNRHAFHPLCCIGTRCGFAAMARGRCALTLD
jgi:hypothetical protein